MNITQLKEQLSACNKCKAILPYAPKPIFQFSKDSRILIAGQAPGRITHKSGIPFDDPSGIRLMEWLGVTKKQFYNEDNFAIIPMSFCFPGQGKSGDLPPIKECAETWRSPILEKLQNVSLTILIGKYAIDWHLRNKKSLTRNVEEWLDHQTDIIPLPHPSPRNNIWLAKNPWFSQEVLPRLKHIVNETLKPNNP